MVISKEESQKSAQILQKLMAIFFEKKNFQMWLFFGFFS